MIETPALSHRLQKALCVFCVCMTTMLPLFAQEATPDITPDTAPTTDGGEGDSLPMGFAGLELGMDRETVEARLQESPYFIYRGTPEVSFEPSRFQELFETEGAGFIDRGIFQFMEGRLYTITLLVNRRRMDHFTLYTRFVSEYGRPVSLNPTESTWERGGYRLSLERPLTVRYLDLDRFAQIQSQSRLEESLEEISRENFLDQF